MLSRIVVRSRWRELPVVLGKYFLEQLPSAVLIDLVLTGYARDEDGYEYRVYEAK